MRLYEKYLKEEFSTAEDYEITIHVNKLESSVDTLVWYFRNEDPRLKKELSDLKKSVYKTTSKIKKLLK